MQQTIPDDPSQLEAIFKQMKEAVKTGQTYPVKFRQKALDNLLEGYEKLIPEFDEALKRDLGYSPFMSNFIAHSVSLGQVKDLRKGASTWVKPQSADTPLVSGIAKSRIQYEPLGLVLVMSAWNYPIYTAIPQVAAGIVAGNSVILKPSELAPHTSMVLEKLFDKYLDKRFYRCIQGQVNVARKLSTLPFDLICFTGSTQTGRLVAIEAAKNLTPCILQLGGKCPVIVDQTANIDSAVKRVIFGKFLNCGQTCIGVDHVYVHESKLKQFKEKLVAQVQKAYGSDLLKLSDQGNYGHIINLNHFKRLQSYLEQSNHKGKYVLKGQRNADKLMIMPTIVQDPHKDSLLLNEQIFGPIMPLIPYSDVNNIISTIQSQPKPLVVYLFSHDQKRIKQFNEKTRSGAFVVNDAVVPLINANLPFGGVGASGYGRYHSKSGFISFSNSKSICQTKAIDLYPSNVRFGPYNQHNKKVMTFLLKVGGITYTQLGKGLKGMAVVAAIVTAAIMHLTNKPKL